MKKVLIVGPLFYGYSKSVAKAFEKENYMVELYDKWKEGTIENFSEKVRFNLAKNKEAFFEKKYEKYNALIRKKYEAAKPDMVFVIRGAILTRDTLLLMKKSRLVLWMMDSIFTVKRTLENIDLYDHVFLFEKEDIPVLKKQYQVDAHFLPLALDESVYFPIPASEKNIDILFVGNLYEKRIALLNKLIERFPEKTIRIYGVYFSRLRNIGRHLFRKDKKYYTNTTVSPDTLNVLYSKTRICLNIHHSQSVYGVNQRFFEISGAGALQVCDRHGFITDNFTDNEIVIFENEQDLFRIVGNILADYDTYIPKIQGAYNKVIQNHTFHERIKFILNTINYRADEE